MQQSIKSEILEHHLGDDSVALVMDGYDDCIAGVLQRFGMPLIVVYDKEKVIQKLVDDGMTCDEAHEFFEYNQLGAWMGEGTPAFITTLECMRSSMIDGELLTRIIYKPEGEYALVRLNDWSGNPRVKGPFIALSHREAEIAIKAIHTVKRAVEAKVFDESLRSEGDHELQMKLEEFYENADVEEDNDG